MKRALKISKRLTDGAVELYFRDLRVTDMVNIDEEIELAARIRKGDEVAKTKLITANLRFVVSTAKQFHTKNFDLMDLIQAGNEGLIEAAMKFDETKGFKFISYAVWWVRQRIQKFIFDYSGVCHVPQNQRVMVKQIFEENNARYALTGIECSFYSEVDTIRKAFNATSPMRLNDPTPGDTPGEIVDFFSEEEKETEDNLPMLKKLLASILTDKEQTALLYKMGFYGELTDIQIGERMNLSRQRAHRLYTSAIAKCKKNKQYFNFLA